MTHKTDAGERRKLLSYKARKIRGEVERARRQGNLDQARRLQLEAEHVLDEADQAAISARLQDMSPWTLEKVRDTKSGPKTYKYWYVSFRQGERVRNIYLGAQQGPRRMDFAKARERAYLRKQEALRYE